RALRTRGAAESVLAIIAVATALLSNAAAVRGEDARALLDKVKQLNQTTRKWSDRVQRMTLTIVDRRGGETRRELEMMTKRYDGDPSRSIVFLHAPGPVQ